MNTLRKYLIGFALLAVGLTSCKNQWDKRDGITDAALTVNVLQQINQNPNLSLFSQYLAKTGYDKVIASSKTYTVWAPNNAAMQTALTNSPATFSDTGKLKQFIGNHISFLSYTTNMASPSIRIKLFDGKSATFTPTTFEEANILQSNIYASNGIIHVIDLAIIPKASIWDYMKSLTNVGVLQQTYLLSQNYLFQDVTMAKQIGVDPLTGLPIYDPNTGIDTLNHYIDQTQNLRSEDNQYTFFILNDAEFTNQTSKVLKYFNTSSSDSSSKLAAFNVIKDLAIPGLYTRANLPDTLVSPNGVKVPINKNAIVSTYNASNGIVYIMSSVPFRLQDKISTIVIQGESTKSFSRTDKTPNIYYRIKNDNNGVLFNDIFIEGNGVGALPAQFYAYYSITNAYSATYRVFWRAINDRGTVFSQQLSFGSPSAATFVYTTVPLLNYSEVYLGTYTVNKYGFQSIYAIGANNTTNGLNSITLDYIKLVPVLQ